MHRRVSVCMYLHLVNTLVCCPIGEKLSGGSLSEHGGKLQVLWWQASTSASRQRRRASGVLQHPLLQQRLQVHLYSSYWHEADG